MKLMKNNKKVALLSSTAIGTLIATALSTTAYAKTVGFLTEKDGKFFEYSRTDLERDYENKVAELDSPLFDKYFSENLVALYDDVRGYINKDSVNKAYEDAVAFEEDFNLDDYTEHKAPESAQMKDVKGANKVTLDKEGKVVVTPNKEKEVKTELKVESVSAINK